MRVIIRNVSSKISSKKERIALNKMLDYLNGYKRECVLAPLFKMLEATFDLFVPLVMADIVLSLIHICTGWTVRESRSPVIISN